MIKKHWTPRYILAKFNEWIYEKRHPGFPWLTPEANKYLDNYLDPEHKMLELGSGRSTLWFAERVGHLTSIEHHEGWYAKINALIHRSELKSKIQYLQRSVVEDKDGNIAYIKEIGNFEDVSLDVILIDGKLRDLCFLACLPKLKPNGIFVIDDANRYFISESKSPYSKRSLDELKLEWPKIHSLTKNWQKFWTSNDIHDTLILIKP